jgi:LysM repeat protein
MGIKAYFINLKFMKTFKFLITLIFLTTSILGAQEKKYTSYIVKKGETIKSIAKEFDISTRDLLRLNPDVSRRPDFETVIIVPNKNYGKNIVKTEPYMNDDDLYEVQPKETIYGISKKFDVSINDLIQANPALENGLKIGMKLHIPKFNQASEKNEDESFVFHTVVKDNTIYNLTKKYQVTEAELLKLNPSLLEGLKLGMVLKIKSLKNNVAHNNILISEEHPIENKELELEYFKENLNFNKRLKVILVLPYQINKMNDSIVGSVFSKNNLTTIATDFHMGAIMAIDSLKNRGLPISVHYFDSENSINKLQYLVNKADFNNADVIIGPLFFDKAEWLSKQVKAPVVVPFYSKNQDSYSATNLIKASPKETLIEDKLITYLERTYNGENIVIINDGKAESQSKLWQTVNKLKTFDGVKEISVIKPERGYIASGRFSEKLRIDSKNWVLLISDDNVTTASSINNLKGLTEKFHITLIALEKGKNFENVDNNNLGLLNFMYPTAEFFNMNTDSIKNFFTKFQLKNNTIPSDYAVRGFDVTYDILVRLASNESLEYGLKDGKSIRVSSSFKYNRKMFGSFENNGIYIVQYTKELIPVILQ